MQIKVLDEEETKSAGKADRNFDSEPDPRVQVFVRVEEILSKNAKGMRWRLKVWPLCCA